MSSIDRFDPGRPRLNDLTARVEDERHLAAIRAAAARTSAELRTAAALYKAARRFPGNPAVARLLERYRDA